MNSSEKSCEITHLGSTGSGIYINLSSDKTVVLTAGHVCDNSIIVPKEDETHTFQISSQVVIQNYKGSYFTSEIILSEHSQKSENDADLCALLVNQKKKSKGISLEHRPPRIGEDIYYMGAPVGIYHPQVH